MDEPSDHGLNASLAEPPARPRRWKRYARWTAVILLVTALCIMYVVKDHVRTLWSLRSVRGTNAYVMDYYADYNLGEIRARGMDVTNVENGLIDVFFPDVIASIAKGAKGLFLEEQVETIPPNVNRCSTIVLRSPGGDVFF